MARGARHSYSRHKACVALAAALVVFATYSLCASAATAPPVTAATATYDDPVGDGGDAPDVASVTVSPGLPGTLRIRVDLAARTELGSYGWILIGFDTDRNAYTGAVLGNDLLLVANGEGAVLERWVRGRFTVDFAHQPVNASLSPTELDTTISLADLGTSRFRFSVATLRQDADLAPDAGAFTYGTTAKPHRDRRGAVQLPPRRIGRPELYDRNRDSAVRLPRGTTVASGLPSLDSQIPQGPTTGTRARWLSPITNESWPSEVDKHFAGKPMATVPATAMGYPDGTCWVYSNKSSWAVVNCAPSSPLDLPTSEDSTTRVRARRLRPITNESWPNEVDKHFAGKPMATVPASTIGYPDGTCWVYSNTSSWAAIKCFGGINTG